MRNPRAFTLVELLFVVVVVGALLAVQAVAVASSRDQSSVRSDIADLRLIAQASAIYSDTYDDRLFTFSWQPGEVPVTPNSQLAAACAALPTTGSNVQRAAVYQQLDLVTRNSDFPQIEPHTSFAPTAHTPYVVYNHLVLAHFMGEALPSEVFTSEGDRPRNSWQADMDAYFDDPFATHFQPPIAPGNFNNLWRWPFSSSYMTGPSHYSNDSGSLSDNPPRTVQRGAIHRQWLMPTSVGVLGTRKINEVTHPSQKVMMFDEYDRYTGQYGQYHGLDDSRSIMVFYDGSAGRLLTAQANFGFVPNNPDFGSSNPDQPSGIYIYRPVAGWNPPDAVEVNVAARYDQTRDGLQGIDYQRGGVRRPIGSP
ncbi:MAG: hypothetical protein Phyf2KO_16640 [Phycisphaerales bacterium]